MTSKEHMEKHYGRPVGWARIEEIKYPIYIYDDSRYEELRVVRVMFINNDGLRQTSFVDISQCFKFVEIR